MIDAAGLCHFQTCSRDSVSCGRCLHRRIRSADTGNLDFTRWHRGAVLQPSSDRYRELMQTLEASSILSGWLDRPRNTIATLEGDASPLA